MDTTNHALARSWTLEPVSPVVDGFPDLVAHLLALAVARGGDRAEAEDLVREMLIAAWQAGGGAAAQGLDRALAERCRRRLAERRAAGAPLGRLIATGGPRPPGLTGPTPGDERPARSAPGGRGDAGGAAVPDAEPTTRPAVRLPAVPADLADDRPIAAALVRAGAPTAPIAPPAPRPDGGRHRRRRPNPAAAGPASPARRDRLQAQLRERARAAERAARRVEQARRDYDRAGDAAARAAADAALATAAGSHERALAICRALARRLGELLAAPAPTDGLARQERRR